MPLEGSGHIPNGAQTYSHAENICYICLTLNTDNTASLLASVVSLKVSPDGPLRTGPTSYKQRGTKAAAILIPHMSPVFTASG